MIRMGDNCGVFGIAEETPCVNDIYRALDFLQHRGQQFCDIATFDETRIRMITHYGTAGHTFTPHELETFKGTMGIGHVSLKERQPMMWQGAVGEIAVAFSGNITNSKALLTEMMERGAAFYHGLDIEIISKLILQEKSVVMGISMLAERIEGAYSLLVLTEEGIYGARDVYGFRPLMLGAGPDVFMVSSESRAVQNLGFDRVRDVNPGEIVLITKQGFETQKQLESPRSAHCAFEWAYTASMDSKIDGLFVQEARNNLGRCLAERDIEEGGLQADLVGPVPMSGIGHALGYHMRSGLPYQEVFLYNRYADRSYTQLTQKDRDQMAKKKLSVLEFAVSGKRIVLCDDSIVRGTQIRDKVRDLKHAGAREVHLRISAPPIRFPCFYGIDFPHADDLIAAEKSVEEIQGFLGVDSLGYQTIDGLLAAVPGAESSYCLACFTGEYPVPVTEDMDKYALESRT